MDENAQPADPAEVGRELKLHFLGLSFDPHRLIYSTIILMTALAIYDEGDERLDSATVATLIGIMVAPLFALTMAHAFSDALDMQIRLGRKLNRTDRRRLLKANAEYMYIAIPPIAITIALAFTAMRGNNIIDIVLWLGLISMFFWGMFAARKAELPRGRQVRTGLNYAVMGLLVLLIELVLTH
ncbi:MAG: hypothetical protein K9G28_10855 [Candidatus Nanopelagicales bacterium]|nr:hypothetical protein [Candidatus Nanopelagicales bacterium]